MPRAPKATGKTRHDPLHVQLGEDEVYAKYGKVSRPGKRRKSHAPEEDDDEEDEDYDGEVDDEPEKLVSPSKRKKKQEQEDVPNIDTASAADTSAMDDDVSEADTAATSVDDGLPHPRVSFLGSPLSGIIAHTHIYVYIYH